MAIRKTEAVVLQGLWKNSLDWKNRPRTKEK